MKPRYSLTDDNKIVSSNGSVLKIHQFKSLREFYDQTINKPIYQIKGLPIGLEVENNLENIEIGEIKRIIDWYYYHIHLKKT